MTQTALAEAAGVSRQAYAAIERSVATPSTEVALRLAVALGSTIEALFRLPDQPRLALQARLTESAPTAQTGPVLANVERVGGQWTARPHGGSALHPAISRSFPVANGVILDGSDPSSATVELLEAPDRDAVVVTGCDPAMSIVAAHLRSQGIVLAWHEMGSKASLAGLAAGHAHIAGCHLLDEASGLYNTPWVERSLPFPATVVTFAVWDQGIVVAPGNPKQVRGVEDLARPGLFMVNREEGSGSRALLDAGLARAGIPAASVAGYHRVATSHLSVAEAVGMGFADAGIAVRAAAIALGLGFVPLGQERYDLVIPDRFLNLPEIQRLLSSLRDPALRRRIELLGGYDVASMGMEPAAA